MNFLAHIYLSGDNPRVMVGNFIGDFVKGRNLLQQFDQDIAFGIELHRSIDYYTDHHPVVKASKLRLWPRYRHYAAVIVDVFYDHFLSHFWSSYSDEPLEAFAMATYAKLKSFEFILPADVKRMLPYMISQNWLVNYGNFDGLGQALQGMSRRARPDSGIEQSLTELGEHYPLFKTEFDQFLPDLIQHSNEILVNSHKNPIRYIHGHA